MTAGEPDPDPQTALAEARAARRDAERTSALKDQFIAIVSHELRAPVTTILLWEKILRDSAAGGQLDAQAVAAIDAIHASALAQARIVDDLLDVSRAISGKLHVQVRAIDIEPVLAAAIAAIAPAALAKQIALERRGGGSAMPVIGDPDRVRQIVDNLLANAVKFTEPLGRVTVAVTRVNREGARDAIAIAISDTGRGIHPDFLPQLFEPFTQTDASLSREGGLGLGLAIAKQLAILHDGTLTAASDGVGRGATFTLTLPCDPWARSTVTAQRRYGPSLAAVRVLVVDDDWRVREALAVLLDRAGAVATTAASAAAARESIEASRPDVLVSDIAMPGEDGYQFLRRLRASGCAIPAIALTAHATAADVERARAAGYELHVAKPVDFDTLVERIGALAARPQIA